MNGAGRTNSRRGHARLVGCCIAAVMLIVADGHLTVSRGEAVLIDDSRVLAAALRQLVQRCHCTVTYEDPRWRRDQVIPTWPGRRRSDGAPRMVPNGIPARFNLPDVGQRVVGADAASHVRDLLREFDDSHNPGSFTLVEDGERVHVIPSRDALLARPVSWVAEGPAYQLVSEFLVSLGHATGEHVFLVKAPINLMTASTTVNAVQRPAYEVLGSLVGSLGRQVSWQLLYDIDERAYYLDLYLAD